MNLDGCRTLSVYVVGCCCFGEFVTFDCDRCALLPCWKCKIRSVTAYKNHDVEAASVIP